MPINLPIKVQAAKVLVCKLCPYFQSCLWRMSPRIAPGLGTMAVDEMGRWYIDDKAVSEWDLGEVVAGVIHEIGHLMLDHSNRMRHRDRWLSQLATDMAIACWIDSLLPDINDKVMADNRSNNGSNRPTNMPIVKQSPKWLHPKRFNLPLNLTAEQYYNLIKDKRNEIEKKLLNLAKKQSQSGLPQQGDQGEDSAGSNNDDDECEQSGDADHDKETASQDGGSSSSSPSGHASQSNAGGGAGAESNQESPNNSSSSGDQTDVGVDLKDKPALGQGGCGSCAAHGRRPWEDPLVGKGTDFPGLTEAEKDNIRREVAAHMKQHFKSRGNVPGYLERWIDDVLLPPKIPWTRKLRSALNAACNWIRGNSWFTWSRRSPHSTRQIPLPGTEDYTPRIAIIVDTSGSMSPTALQKAVSESAAIIKAANIDSVHWLAVDAAVNECRKIRDVKDVKLIGGGGTDMSLGIKTAMELKPRPNIIVVLTDGYTPWPDQQVKNTRVIAVIIEGGKELPPDWIETIQYEEETSQS